MRRHVMASVLALAAFAAIWGANLAANGCNSMDALDCTAVGWVLLYAWGVAGAVAGALVVSLAVRALIRGLRARPAPSISSDR